MRTQRLSAKWWLLLPVVTAVVAATLARFATIVQAYLAVDYDLRIECSMVTGQVLFQWAVLWRRTWAERSDYGVIVLGVSTFGAVLLWPLLAWHAASPVTALAATAYFSVVVGVMFVTHVRLLQRLQLPGHLTVTWVVYRLFLLAVLVRWSALGA